MEIPNLGVPVTRSTTNIGELREAARSLLGIDLPDYTLKVNASALRTARESKEQCAACQGREHCQLEMPGYESKAVFYAGNVSIVYGRCAKDVEYERRKYIEHLVTASRLPAMMREKTLENFSQSPQNLEAWQLAKRAAEGDIGIFFSGSPGTGKTHLAVAVANYRMVRGREAVFVTVPELLSDIREAMKNGQDSELMEIVKTCELLVLDDLGAEKATEWVMEQLFMIVNARYMARRQTIVTSNLTKSELIEKANGIAGQRIISRISEMCVSIRMQGRDYRLGVR